MNVDIACVLAASAWCLCGITVLCINHCAPTSPGTTPTTTRGACLAMTAFIAHAASVVGSCAVAITIAIDTAMCRFEMDDLACATAPCSFRGTPLLVLAVLSGFAIIEAMRMAKDLARVCFPVMVLVSAILFVFQFIATFASATFAMILLLLFAFVSFVASLLFAAVHVHVACDPYAGARVAPTPNPASPVAQSRPNADIVIAFVQAVPVTRDAPAAASSQSE